jgi:hypothetical protein
MLKEISNRLKKFLNLIFLINNIVRDILMSRVGTMHDITSEKVLSS